MPRGGEGTVCPGLGRMLFECLELGTEKKLNLSQSFFVMFQINKIDILKKGGNINQNIVFFKSENVQSKRFSILNGFV